MKNKMKLVALLFTMGIALVSCKKENGGGDNPNPNPDPNPDPTVVETFGELWNYTIFEYPSKEDFHHNYGEPAIDENNNIYAISSQVSNEVLENNFTRVAALNKDGDLLWQKDFSGSDAQQLVYYENKLFFVSTRDFLYGLSEVPVTLYFLNASDGSIIQSHNLTNLYDIHNDNVKINTISVSNNRLYIRLDMLSERYIFAFELDGTLAWTKVIENVGTTADITEMLCVDNSIYVLGDGLTKYVDNGSSCDLNWTVAGGYIVFLTDMNLIMNNDDNLCFRYRTSEYGDEYLKIVSQEGEVIKDILIPNAYKSAERIFCTKEGDYLFSEFYDFMKMDTDGNALWEYNSSHGTLSCIAANGNIYSNGLSGSEILTASGTKLDKLKGKGNITYMHNGNIARADIYKVYCIKGDGSELDMEGWPRRFGNYGNTNSK